MCCAFCGRACSTSLTFRYVSSFSFAMAARPASLLGADPGETASKCLFAYIQHHHRQAHAHIAAKLVCGHGPTALHWSQIRFAEPPRSTDIVADFDRMNLEDPTQQRPRSSFYIESGRIVPYVHTFTMGMSVPFEPRIFEQVLAAVWETVILVHDSPPAVETIYALCRSVSWDATSFSFDWRISCMPPCTK